MIKKHQAINPRTFQEPSRETSQNTISDLNQLQQKASKLSAKYQQYKEKFRELNQLEKS